MDTQEDKSVAAEIQHIRETMLFVWYPRVKEYLPALKRPRVKGMTIVWNREPTQYTWLECITVEWVYPYAGTRWCACFRHEVIKSMGMPRYSVARCAALIRLIAETHPAELLILNLDIIG